MSFDDGADDRCFYIIPPIAALPEIRRTGSKLIQTCAPSIWEISNVGDAGSGEYLEIGENSPTRANGETPGFRPFSSFTVNARCYLDASVDGGLGTAAFCGFQIGSLGHGPAFPGANPTSPVIQWRWFMSLDTVALFTAKGDGTAGALTTPVAAPGGRSTVKILWEPDVPRCRVYQNGELVCSQTNAAVLPDFSIAHDSGIGVAAYTGTASSEITLSVGPIRVSYLGSLNQG